MANIGVAVLTFNPGRELVDTIDAILASAVSPECVLIVDNASADRTVVEVVRGSHPSLKLLALDSNVGYGGAMNRAARELRALGLTRLCFLTQECLLADGALARMTRHLDNEPGVGVVGPLLARQSSPEVVWSAGGQLTRFLGKPVHVWAERVVRDCPSGLHDVQWLDGACLLVRGNAWEATGGFREDLFLYWEDVQISLTLKSRGWRVCCATDALAFQEPSMTPPYLMSRNRALVLGARGALGAVWDSARWGARELMTGKSRGAARLGWAGLRDAFRNAPLDRQKALERP